MLLCETDAQAKRVNDALTDKQAKRHISARILNSAQILHIFLFMGGGGGGRDFRQLVAAFSRGGGGGVSVTL